MAGGRLRHYRLAPAAETDLEDIWRYTARNWSIEQADRYTDALENAFDTLVAMPEIAREHRDFDPPVRVHPTAQHVIVDRIEADHLVIFRVLGGPQNCRAFFDLAD
jgi:toxin ParE1/3/4